jgi:hypothetical protein
MVCDHDVAVRGALEPDLQHAAVREVDAPLGHRYAITAVAKASKFST